MEAPEDLGLKDGPEVPRNRMGDFQQIEFSVQFLRHRSDGLRRDTARDDEIEVVEIDVHIEREAV